MSTKTITKQANTVATTDADSAWTGIGLQALAGRAAPTSDSPPAIRIVRAGITELSAWPSVTFGLPDMGIPANGTLLGLRCRVWCHKLTDAFPIDDGGGGTTTQNSGMISVTKGNYDISSGEGYNEMIGPYTHVDSMPVGTGNVKAAEYIDIGGPTELFNQVAAAFKSQLNANTGSDTIRLLMDMGIFNPVTDGATFTTYNMTEGQEKTIASGAWTVSGVVTEPIGYLKAQGDVGPWTPVSQVLTAAQQNFVGLVIPWPSMESMPDAFTPTGAETIVFGQNRGLGIGAAVGKINVDGTDLGSKAVANSGMIYIAKGTTAAFGNIMSDSAYKSHLDLFTTDATLAVTTSEKRTLGSGANDLHGFANSAAFKAQLKSNVGANKLWLVIDSGKYYRAAGGDSRAVDIGKIQFKVYGNINDSLTSRSIAAVEWTAFYDDPNSVSTTLNAALFAAIGAIVRASYPNRSQIVIRPDPDVTGSWILDNVTDGSVPAAVDGQVVESFAETDAANTTDFYMRCASIAAELKQYTINRLTLADVDLGVTPNAVKYYDLTDPT